MLVQVMVILGLLSVVPVVCSGASGVHALLVSQDVQTVATPSADDDSAVVDVSTTSSGVSPQHQVVASVLPTTWLVTIALTQSPGPVAPGPSLVASLRAPHPPPPQVS